MKEELKNNMVDFMLEELKKAEHNINNNVKQLVEKEINYDVYIAKSKANQITIYIVKDLNNALYRNGLIDFKKYQSVGSIVDDVCYKLSKADVNAMLFNLK